MFSTFPGGSPGFGLLILRAALGSATLLRGAGYLSERGDPGFLNLIGGLIAVALGAFLLIGFLTPVIAAIAFAGGILALVANQNPLLEIEIYAGILASAIVFLGPGAFSLDARLFGRREIIIPKNPPASNI